MAPVYECPPGLCVTAVPTYWRQKFSCVGTRDIETV